MMKQGRPVVLVADDDESILRMLTAGLASACDVLTASDGAHAIDMFRLGQDHIDVVLLDLGMPGTSGYEALAQLQLLDPDVQVVVITGLEPDEERLPGVARIIHKPFRIDEVRNLVLELAG